MVFCSSRAATALALKSGDKKGALRHARRLKVLTTSKGKCETFMDRIDEVLTSIADAEATRKVSNAYFCCSGCSKLTSKYVPSRRNGQILCRGVYCMTGFLLGFHGSETWTW